MSQAFAESTSAEAATAPSVAPVVHEALGEPAHALDEGTLSWAEGAFGQDLGRDLSHVRVHDGGRAQGSALALRAAAFTVGNDIVFGPGRYAPATPQGRALLAHELTHVLQRRDRWAPAAAPEQVAAPDAASEREAHAAASAIAAGRRPAEPRVRVAPATISRLPASTGEGHGQNAPVTADPIEGLEDDGPRVADKAQVAAAAWGMFTALEGDPDKAAEVILATLRRYRPQIPELAERFEEESPMGLRARAIQALKRDHRLVRILALLFDGSETAHYAKLGIALIPRLTGNPELDTIFGTFAQDGPNLRPRQTVEFFYNVAFAGVGRTAKDTLREHIVDAVSSPDRDRYLLLLRRNLTPADQLHLVTTAKWLADSIAALGIIQAEYEKGLRAFERLHNDWEVLRNDREGSHVFVTTSLRESMRRKLNLDQRLIAEATFMAYDEKTRLWAGIQRAQARGRDPGAEAIGRRREAIEEELALVTIDLSSNRFGVGTDVEQVHGALVKLRETYEWAIARAQANGDEARVRELTATWAATRSDLTLRIQGGWAWKPGHHGYHPGALGGAALVKGLVLLQGKLSLADEAWLAQDAGDQVKVLDIVTTAWLKGDEDVIWQEAGHPPEGSPRPAFALGKMSLPQVNPEADTFGIELPKVELGDTPADEKIFTMASPLRSAGHFERGAQRLRMDLEGTGRSTANADLADAQTFLKRLDDDNLEVVLNAFFKLPGILNEYFTFDGAYFDSWSSEEFSSRSRFVIYLGGKFSSSALLEDVKNLVTGPATSAHEAAIRVLLRYEASHTGLFDPYLVKAVKLLDYLTGNATQMRDRESIEDAEAVAGAADAAATGREGPLAVLLAETGAKDQVDLANRTMKEAVSRQDEARSLRGSVAEFVGTVIDVGLRSILVAGLGPIGIPGLAAALGAFMSGMLVREGLLGNEYDLFSEKNLSTLLEEVGTFGLEKINLDGIVSEFFSADAVRKTLSSNTVLRTISGIERAEGRDAAIAAGVQAVLKAGASKVTSRLIARLVAEQGLPDAAELEALAINWVLLGVSKPFVAEATKRLTIFSGSGERIRRNYLSILMNGPPPKAALPTVLLKEFYKISIDPNFAHMSAQDIFLRMATASLSPFAGALSVSLALSHIQTIQAGEARQFARDNPEHIHDLIRADPTLGPLYRSYAAAPLKPGEVLLPPAQWLNSLGSYQSVEGRTAFHHEQAAVAQEEHAARQAGHIVVDESLFRQRTGAPPIPTSPAEAAAAAAAAGPRTYTVMRAMPHDGPEELSKLIVKAAKDKGQISMDPTALSNDDPPQKEEP